MGLRIEKEYDLKLDFDLEEVAAMVTEAVIEEEGCPYECEINLLFVDNKTIQQINKEYRNIDSPTDVLSFPMLEGACFEDFEQLEEKVEEYFHPDTGELLLGDIVVSLDKVCQQAESYGHSKKREYAFLIAHSMLHLFGYDHMTAKEAAKMEEKQTIILDGLGITR